ncbi:hypothetical protein A2841_03450 [Candidatus Kaiserbacteria bacterium RIFCSPHIGHO2_01_FULL_48_10]|uniref:Uncharacterized protein n=1 Tax=Candidatus Kaiserbacteria bacterium RIFCSPHIGHO2_01_FULL_48_10 TaxID=1798476 RepID=A0A1F6CC30_9BACT|nr:MAG: hypothetical protein A2841_03450 [Candidatus Kaiserbacteria bacterium RIFCSPHIGHO2_01_FULL_48_10]
MILAASSLEAAPTTSPENTFPQRELTMTETLKQLGALGLFSGATISGVPFQNAYPLTSGSDSQASSVMPNLRDRSNWVLPPEYDIRYWLRGSCIGKELFVGLSVSDPANNVKAFTDPWDDALSTENLEGGAAELPEWVRGACRPPSS